MCEQGSSISMAESGNEKQNIAKKEHEYNKIFNLTNDTASERRFKDRSIIRRKKCLLASGLTHVAESCYIICSGRLNRTAGYTGR